MFLPRIFLLLLINILFFDLRSQKENYLYLHDIYAGSIEIDNKVYSVRMELNMNHNMMYGAIGNIELSSKIKILKNRIFFYDTQLFEKKDNHYIHFFKYKKLLNEIKMYKREKMCLLFFERSNKSIMKLKKID